jgi:23S rRNA (uracil1939-C5)-methyltransferase
MSRSAVPLTPHEGVTRLEIDAFAAGGRGVGRVEGRVWLVRGAAAGDRVAARVIKDHGRFVEAELVEIERASMLRRIPACPIQARCGGCPLMVVQEVSQREIKHRLVADAVRRIGKLPEQIPVEPVIPAPQDLRYRNRIELTFGQDDSGRRVLGYHAAGSASKLVDVESCVIADARLQPLLAAAREYFLTGAGASDPALGDLREPLRLVLRASAATDERLIALRGLPGPFRSAVPFSRAVMAADPVLAGVVRILTAPGRRGGARTETVAGRDWIAERIHGTEFRVPAATFLQVHPAAAEGLGAHVLDVAGSVGSALELYGGIGAIGLALARRGSRATIVDADPAAIACGSEAARAAGISGVTFERADVLSYLSRRGAGAAPEILIADPPRTGLGRGVARLIAAVGAPRIAMISCDPATLARDLAALGVGGYAVERLATFDLFPQTAHVEAVAWLARR